MRSPLQRPRSASLALTAALLLGALPGAQRTQPSDAPRPARSPRTLAPPGWYSGDTHEHVQNCDDTLHSTAEIRARMELEDLNVSSVLIWERARLPFTESICRVVGHPDPLSDAERILQYGVETSGLSCARWGHLSGLGVGPDQARIAAGALLDGDCADMPGLGLGGDGSGTLSAPVARLFYTSPGAVCGYAHTVWTAGLYVENGYDWTPELVANGYALDIFHLTQLRKLAFPNVERLLTGGTGVNTLRPFFPLFGAVDAALGNVQFVEVIFSGPTFPVPVSPPAEWNALYYKLLSAGLRIGLAGGSDRACFAPPPGRTPMRTHARVDGFLSYAQWTRAVALGRTSIAYGNDLFLRMTIDGAEVGSDVYLASPDPRATVCVELSSLFAIEDSVELVVQGEVVASQPIQLNDEGDVEVRFEGLSIPISSWVAARLGSQRAHTAAIYAIVDGRPITSPHSAEYWMVWCDAITRSTLEHPEDQYFGSQEQEALDSLAMARRAFKTLRDVSGFDPNWEVLRHGTSTPACRGPITIGTTAPARRNTPLLFTCVNAPPLAQGVLYLSREMDSAGSCQGDVRLFVATDPQSLIAEIPVQSTRSGYAEVEFTPFLESDPVLHAQFVWTNPRGCEGPGCNGLAARRAASDALELCVEAPGHVGD